jgi:hypothetical protein
MNRTVVWVSASALLALAGGLYLVRSLGAGAPDAAARADGQAADRPAIAHREPISAADRPGSTEPERGTRTRNLHGTDSPGQSAGSTTTKDPGIDAREREFIARMFTPPGPKAPEQERLAWEQSPISDLLYPEGHACAGEPLDSVSPELLASVGREGLAKLIDAVPDVDTPQCLFQGRWNFHPLNAACSTMHKQDPDSVERCTTFLVSAQQDPAAYPATIWLPCINGRGQPTTMRAYYEDLLTQQVDQMFASRRCAAR